MPRGLHRYCGAGAKAQADFRGLTRPWRAALLRGAGPAFRRYDHSALV